MQQINMFKGAYRVSLIDLENISNGIQEPGHCEYSVQVQVDYTGDEYGCPWVIERCYCEKKFRYWNCDVKDDEKGGIDNPILFNTLREARAYAEITE